MADKRDWADEAEEYEDEKAKLAKLTKQALLDLILEDRERYKDEALVNKMQKTEQQNVIQKLTEDAEVNRMKMVQQNTLIAALQNEKQKIKEDAEREQNELKNEKKEITEKNDKLDTEHKNLKEENVTLQEEKKNMGLRISDLKKELDTTKKNLDTEKTKRSEVLEELASTSQLLEEQKKLTEELLEQLDDDCEEPINNNFKKVMLLMDSTRLNIRPYLMDGRHNWTMCTTVDKVNDIVELLQNPTYLAEIKGHDKVVIACGLQNILENENGRQVATNLLKMAERVTKATGLEVAIVALPPTNIKPGQALLCNMRLGKMPQVPNIEFVSLDKLDSMEKKKVLNEENSLTPEAAKIMVQILNDIEVSGTRQMADPPTGDSLVQAAQMSDPQMVRKRINPKKVVTRRRNRVKRK